MEVTHALDFDTKGILNGILINGKYINDSFDNFCLNVGLLALILFTVLDIRMIQYITILKTSISLFDCVYLHK